MANKGLWSITILSLTAVFHNPIVAMGNYLYRSFLTLRDAIKNAGLRLSVHTNAYSILFYFQLSLLHLLLSTHKLSLMKYAEQLSISYSKERGNF